MSKIIDPRERAESPTPRVQHVDFYAEALKASEQFRKDYQGRLNVVKSARCRSSVRPTASSSTSSTSA